MAAPVAWEELDGLDTATRYSIAYSAVLVARALTPDLKNWGWAEQALPDV